MGAEKGLIFGSQPCESWMFLKPLLDWPDLVISADGGLRCARDAGFSPQVYVGDGDSGGRPEPGLRCVSLKPEKDVTDLEAAYDWARGHGLRELIFTAAPAAGWTTIWRPWSCWRRQRWMEFTAFCWTRETGWNFYGRVSIA